MESKIKNVIDTATRNVLVVLMGVLVLNVVWQVFTRFVLDSPSTFTDELARFLLIWVSLLGAAYMTGQGGHVAITLLPSKLSEENQRKLVMFINTLIILFVTAVFIVGSGYQVYLKFIYREIAPALQISMGWVYLIGPISGLLIIYYKLNEILQLWASSK